MQPQMRAWKEGFGSVELFAKPGDGTCAVR